MTAGKITRMAGRNYISIYIYHRSDSPNKLSCPLESSFHLHLFLLLIISRKRKSQIPRFQSKTMAKKNKTRVSDEEEIEAEHENHTESSSKEMSLYEVSLRGTFASLIELHLRI